jgi:hypothetical protein
VHDVSTSPASWLTVAAVFAVNGLLSWAWDAPVLALAQAVTGGLAALAGWAARHRTAVRAEGRSVSSGE